MFHVPTVKFLNLSIAQAGTVAPVVVTGIAAVAGIAAEAGTAAAGIAEAGIAGDPGIAAAGVGKLLETGTAGAEVGAGIPAEAVELVPGQTAQTGQTRQSPETVVQRAVGPSGSQRIQRPGAATGQLDQLVQLGQLVQQQTGCRRLRLRTGSKLFLSSTAGQRR